MGFTDKYYALSVCENVWNTLIHLFKKNLSLLVTYFFFWPEWTSEIKTKFIFSVSIRLPWQRCSQPLQHRVFRVHCNRETVTPKSRAPNVLLLFVLWSGYCNLLWLDSLRWGGQRHEGMNVHIPRQEQIYYTFFFLNKNMMKSLKWLHSGQGRMFFFLKALVKDFSIRASW